MESRSLCGVTTSRFRTKYLAVLCPRQRKLRRSPRVTFLDAALGVSPQRGRGLRTTRNPSVSLARSATTSRPTNVATALNKKHRARWRGPSHQLGCCDPSGIRVSTAWPPARAGWLRMLALAMPRRGPRSRCRRFDPAPDTPTEAADTVIHRLLGGGECSTLLRKPESRSLPATRLPLELASDPRDLRSTCSDDRQVLDIDRMYDVI